MPRPNINVAAIATVARSIRENSLQMVHRAKIGHPGGDMSCADILATLYSSVLNVNPAMPSDPNRDRFVMSKGHSSAALYSALAEAGFFPREKLMEFAQPLSALNGHPARNKMPGVEASTGPLGHGLPISVGMAEAAKIAGAAWRVFVLTGDGELQEGSNWEAAMSAAQFKLDHLTLIVDRNGLQQGDATENTVGLEPIGERWRSFGWSVQEVDGHDVAALAGVLRSTPFQTGRPSCVIARTHKGHGISFMEDRVEWHHRVPTDAELAAALAELGRQTSG